MRISWATLGRRRPDGRPAHSLDAWSNWAPLASAYHFATRDPHIPADEEAEALEDALAEKRYNEPVAARYGLVAALLRAQDLKRAQTELAILEKSAPPHPMIEGMAGQVLLQSGKVKEAIVRYEAALARYPNKRQLVYDYPEALLKDNQPAKAAAFLNEQLLRYPTDGPLQLLAARSYSALGKQTLAHRHQAEYYAWLGNLNAAVIQYELAVKAGDADFYQASVTESRLRDLRQEVIDQKKRVSQGGPG